MKKDFHNMLIETLRQAGRKGLTSHELSGRMKVKRHQRDSFYRALGEALKNREITEKRGRYVAASRPEKHIVARILSVKEGFGFAGSEELERDLFIPGRGLHGAMPGDQVELRSVRGRGELPEAEVVAVLEQNDAPFSGVFRKRDGQCAILPDQGSRIAMRVSPGDTLGARDGDKVLGRIIRRGDNHYTHRAAVLEVFGSAGSAASCSEAILAASGVEKEFSPEVLQWADRVSRMGIAGKDYESRLDLRGEKIFTIDGADTKDIDDAISLDRVPGGWNLGVHIADVSYYVRPNTPLDREAFERGTSVYYANSVVPMLPPVLSNGICSLNPGEDRLAFSALMTLDEKGALKDWSFRKTIIRSRVKGVYSEVNQLLEGTASKAVLRKYEDLSDKLSDMRELAGLLRRRRWARGAVDLHSTESKILVGPDGRAQEIQPRQTGVSEDMIEEFMLTANEAAATLAMEQAIPFVYRIHENPPPDKLEHLCELLERLGLDAGELRKNPSSGALSHVLKAAEGTPLELLVNNQILRSMAKAKYSAVNRGHFGLVLQNYAHFTSPIRRYPDLVVHRVLGSFLSGMKGERLAQKYGGFVERAAEQSSQRELRAMTVERGCEDCYKAEYMAGHLGERFQAVITSVTARGVYVELPNTVEGMIRLESLPEGGYDYDGAIRLTNLQDGTAYQPGMPVMVQAVAADVSAGTVDFVLIKG